MLPLDFDPAAEKVLPALIYPSVFPRNRYIVFNGSPLYGGIFDERWDLAAGKK